MNKKVVGIYCDKTTIINVAYTIKEKIGCKAIRTLFNFGYSRLDILAENGINYLVINMSEVESTVRGLKVDEVWYSFSKFDEEKYFELIKYFNHHLSDDKFYKYEDI